MNLPTAAEIDAMSPAEAGATLAEMTKAFHPEPPVNPQTASDARRRLEALTRDKEWGAKFLAGDADARKEFNALQERIAKGDDVLTDALAPRPFGIEMTTGGQPPATETRNAVAHLRDLGFTDNALKDVLSGKVCSAEEVKMASELRARAMRDPVFTKSWLSGDPDAARQMLVWNSVIVSHAAA